MASLSAANVEGYKQKSGTNNYTSKEQISKNINVLFSKFQKEMKRNWKKPDTFHFGTLITFNKAKLAKIV